MKPRLWTMAELHRASSLWSEGRPAAEISAMIGRDGGSFRHQVAARRDLFPRRRQARAEIRNDGEPVTLKFSVPPFLHRRIKRAASERGVSMCMVVREALREKFLVGAIKRGPGRPPKEASS